MFSKRTMFAPLLVGLAALYSIGCSAVAAPIVTPQPVPEARPPAATASAPAPTKGPVIVPIVPTIKPTIVPTPTATPIPLLGNDYQERLVRAGYSRDISQRIASLRYNVTNRRFADELLLIGEKAGYAQERLVKLALSAMEDGDISEDELAVVTDPDKDGKDNETEINDKSNVLDRFNRLPPSVDAFAVLDDELYAVVAGNDELSYAFNLQNFKSMIRELNAPYKDALLTRLDKLSQAWNYKVRREDEVLCGIIPKYQSGFDCNSAEAWHFRFDNGSYHLKSWLKYKETGDVNYLHILPLDNVGMSEWFPKKENREFVYMNGLWVPDSMLRLDLSDMKNDANRIGMQRDAKQWVNLRNNMDVILGVKNVNGLPYIDLRSRIVNVVNDSKLKSYGDRQSRGDLFGAKEYWKTQTRPGPPGFGFNNTLSIFGQEFVPVLESKWKEFPYIVVAFGLGMDDGFVNGVREQWDTAINQIYQKANGFAGFDGSARYPTHNGEHQAILFPVPYNILLLLPNERIVYKGQTIGPYSALRGLRQDRIPYVRTPNSTEITWRLD